MKLFCRLLATAVLTVLIVLPGSPIVVAASASDSSIISLIRAISFARARPLTLAQIRTITNLVAAHRVAVRSTQSDPVLISTIKALDAAVLAGDLAGAQVLITNITTRRSDLTQASLNAATEFQLGMVSVLKGGGQFDVLVARNGQHRVLEIIGNLIGYQSLPEAMVISNAINFTLRPLNSALVQARTAALNPLQAQSVNRSAATYRASLPANVDPLLMSADGLLEQSILAVDRDAARVHIQTLATRQAQLDDLQMQSGSQFQIAVGGVLKSGNQLEPLVAKYGPTRTLDVIGDVVGYDSDGDNDDNNQTGTDDGGNDSIDADDDRNNGSPDNDDRDGMDSDDDPDQDNDQDDDSDRDDNDRDDDDDDDDRDDDDDDDRDDDDDDDDRDDDDDDDDDDITV